MKIEWSEMASESLYDVFDYTDCYFGESQIRRIDAQIKVAERQLMTFPYSGVAIQDERGLKMKLYALTITRELRMFYRVVDDETVWIEAIWDTRRNLKELYDKIIDDKEI